MYFVLWWAWGIQERNFHGGERESKKQFWLPHVNIMEEVKKKKKKTKNHKNPEDDFTVLLKTGSECFS